jgi:hypothetical protein
MTKCLKHGGSVSSSALVAWIPGKLPKRDFSGSTVFIEGEFSTRESNCLRVARHSGAIDKMSMDDEISRGHRTLQAVGGPSPY